MFKWQNSFSSGIPEIDRQHQKLFEIGARVYETATLNDEFDHYDELTQTIQELLDYTQYHFGFEEDLFKKLNYENAATHKVEHDFFVKKLQKISRKDLEDNQGQTLIEIMTFLADWIAGHILGSDMKYRECFKKGGV
jgi:hemerythrin